MKQIKNLAELDVGEHARVAGLYIDGGMRRRLLDIGLTEGARVSCVGKSPLGDPKAFLIRGAVIAMRREDCERITVLREGDRVGE